MTTLIWVSAVVLAWMVLGIVGYIRIMNKVFLLGQDEGRWWIWRMLRDSTDREDLIALLGLSDRRDRKRVGTALLLGPSLLVLSFYDEPIETAAEWNIRPMLYLFGVDQKDEAGLDFVDKERAAVRAVKIVAQTLLNELSSKELKILHLWASGEDTYSVAKAFGVSVEEVESVKALTFKAAPKGRGARIWLMEFFQVCMECGKHRAPDHKYCGYCGNENRFFDESTFLMVNEESISAAMAKECYQGHPSVKEDPELWKLTPYCNHCGAKII